MECVEGIGSSEGATWPQDLQRVPRNMKKYNRDIAMDNFNKVKPISEGYVVKGGVNTTSRITVRPPAPAPMRPSNLTGRIKVQNMDDSQSPKVSTDGLVEEILGLCESLNERIRQIHASGVRICMEVLHFRGNPFRDEVRVTRVERPTLLRGAPSDGDTK